MTHIKNEMQYKAAMKRIEELLPVVTEDTPAENKNSVELVLLSNLVADYDDVHYPIAQPTLANVLKLRMYEKGLTPKKLAELIGVSPSRVSEYLTEKSEPTLKVGRETSLKLNIDPAIVLGV